MKNITKDIKIKLQNFGKNYKAKINYLRDLYKNEDCYILACGPSLNEYSPEFLKEFLRDKLVFSIKTVYNILDHITDFHFFNCCNLPSLNPSGEHYTYKDTISISSSNFAYGLRWSPFQKTDIFFRIPTVTNQTSQQEFLSINKKFDQFLFEKTFDRPLGPGIMYETVLFTAIHLGVKSITTLGWDLSGDKHFYTDDKSLVNGGSVMSWELDSIIESSKDIYEFLKSINIDMYCASKNSYIYNGIERIDLNEKK